MCIRDRQALMQRTLDARISAGLGREQPRLGEEGMVRGLAAIQDLLAAAGEFLPARIVLVATSAVRGAVNGGEFCACLLYTSPEPVGGRLPALVRPAKTRRGGEPGAKNCP